ncbi:MAG: diacylglycerol kinase family protein [Smithellaceae bacterium]|nr:diacylglycerol kinase family protein [Smithellaceae bacterium]
MYPGKVAIIVNPQAGGGSAGKHWPLIEGILRERLGTYQLSLTRGPGDATVMTRDYLREGADLIICVGGDGTLNEVVNGFIEGDAPIRKESVLAFIPNGTGCDFVRTASIPANIGQSVDNILRGHVRKIDVGKLHFTDGKGKKQSRYFHNITSFGLGGEVDARVNRTSKAFGPFLSFIWSTIVSILCYGKKTVQLEVDDHYSERVLIWNIAVANGRYHGGGMLVAPEADLEDGVFHVVVIGDLTLFQVFRHLPKLYNGQINKLRQVTTLTGRKITATSPDYVLLDVDGEQPGRLPVTLEILPGILPLIVRKA